MLDSEMTGDMCIEGPTLYIRMVEKFEDWVFLQEILDGHDGWPYTAEKAKSQIAAMRLKLKYVKFPYGEDTDQKTLSFGCLKSTGLPIAMSINHVYRTHASIVYSAVHQDYRLRGYYAEFQALLSQTFHSDFGGLSASYKVPSDQKFSKGVGSLENYIETSILGGFVPIKYQHYQTTKEQWDFFCSTEEGKKGLVEYTIHKSRPEHFKHV
jgi:hypothetical protein